jgi:hypothetical protein
VRRTFALCTLFLLWADVPKPAQATAAGVAPVVRLAVFDAAGHRLSFAQTLAVTTNGKEGWRDDVTYRIGDGTVVGAPALFADGGAPAFRVTEPGVGLSLAWRTASTGYSTLFVDDLGVGFSSAGTVNLTYRAALDYRAKLAAALARRPAYTPNPAFTEARDTADALIAKATASGVASERGALGQQALDALARAFERLLEGDGRQEGRTRDPWWGVTVDRTEHPIATATSIHDLVDGHSGDAYARIVFDPGKSPASYDRIVRQMRGRGVVVVGQILDSFSFRTLSLAGWRRRVRAFVGHFPGIDVWEFGNEVNGEWLGAQVARKLEFAARYVKARDPSDTTMLTFYWQMGSAGRPDNALFQWIHDHVSTVLASRTDVVALSTWIGDAPLGLAHDEVFERLHAAFPAARVAMGELGYWERDTSRAWWWRARTHPTTTVRRALARHMYLANLAFPYAVGGVFWWYYVPEMSRRQPLWRDVRGIYRSVEG